MQVGMIGLGRMGMNMSRRLLKGGHEVVVYNRTRDKVKQIEEEGAIGSYSLEELVRKYPDRIYVEFASFSADTSKRTYEHIDPRHVPKSAQPGFEVGSLEGRPFCAYIMVNHRIGFVVEGRKVILAGPPGALYTIEDLDRIVRREMELQYGRAPKEGGRVPARQR